MQDESKHAVGCYPQGERASFRWPGGPTLADRSVPRPSAQGAVTYTADGRFHFITVRTEVPKYV